MYFIIELMIKSKAPHFSEVPVWEHSESHWEHTQLLAGVIFISGLFLATWEGAQYKRSINIYLDWLWLWKIHSLLKMLNSILLLLSWLLLCENQDWKLSNFPNFGNKKSHALGNSIALFFSMGSLSHIIHNFGKCLDSTQHHFLKRLTQSLFLRKIYIFNFLSLLNLLSTPEEFLQLRQNCFTTRCCGIENTGIRWWTRTKYSAICK